MKRKKTELLVKDLHYNLLKLIDLNPGIHLSKMNNICTYSHRTKILEQFRKLGFVHRKKDKKVKGNILNIYLTDKGKKVLEHLDNVERLKK